MSQRAPGSAHGYLHVDGSVGGGLSRAGHVRSRWCLTVARPPRWWLACCEATAVVRGVLRRVRRGCGCTESLREALRGWLAVEECQRGLMDPVARDYEITALCNGIHSKVGMGRS